MTDPASLPPSIARIDLWIDYNGTVPWPGEDQCVIDNTTPEAPLLRRDIQWLANSYHRLRHQNYRLKRERDQLARRQDTDEPLTSDDERIVNPRPNKITPPAKARGKARD